MNKAELIKSLESYPDDVEILVYSGEEGLAYAPELTEVFAVSDRCIARNGFATWECGVDPAPPEFHPDNDPNGTRPALAVMLRRSWA